MPTATLSTPRRPRVGIDFHTFDGKFQGSRSHILGLYQSAVAMAPEIDFVFFLAHPERLRTEHPAFTAPNVKLVGMPARNALLRMGWQLPWLQRRERLDLLHMQYRLPFISPCPVACTIHDVLFESHPQYFPGTFMRLLRWTGRRAVREAALLFAVSEFTRDELQRIYGVNRQRVAITCNGVDTRRFKPGPDGSAHVRARGLVPGSYLCTVGRIEPRKNHLNLLRALALMPKPRQPLVVIGHGDVEFEGVHRAVQELGLVDDVIFLDSVDDRELPALIRHASVFVYPSFAEGFGMPVAEAMASGVAVVTSDTTSLPEICGGAALTANPHDPTDIAAALLALLADPVRRQALARRGQAQAARYHWHAAAEVLIHSFRQYFEQQSEPQPERQLKQPQAAPAVLPTAGQDPRADRAPAL